MHTSEQESRGPRSWRRHSAEFRQMVIGKCLQPGVSVAAVALAHGLNANMLRKWVKAGVQSAGASPVGRVTRPDAARDVGTFVPLEVSGTSVAEPIRIDLHRSGLAVSVSWPVGAAGECAAWMRELLR